MKDKYELKTTERDLELNGDDIGFHCLQRIRHDARLAHELLERVQFLERVLGLATLDMWVEGDKIMMQVGDDTEPDCIGPFEYERVDIMPELATWLESRGLDDVPDIPAAPASDAGQENK